MKEEIYHGLKEIAYQTYLEIRPVALVGDSTGEFSLPALEKLEYGRSNYPEVIFAIVVFSNDRHFALYARHQWAIDLYQWAAKQPHDIEHSIRGLLHGIPAKGIEEFLERCREGGLV